MGDTRPRYVLTLVHGTFARGADWTKSGSVLRNTLNRYLEESVEFRSFEWSGDNNHPARLIAGQHLQQFLRNSSREFPSSKHFLIAHSHGGNVVLYALRDPEVRSAISGVITMGTPFISCKPRDVSRAIDALRFAIPATTFMFMALLVCSVVVGADLPNRLDNHWPTWHLGFGFGLFGPIMIGVMAWRMSLERFYAFINEDMRLWVHSRQKLLAARFDAASFSSPPLLCAIVPGDEAGLWLRLIREVAGGPNLGFSLLASAFKRAIWILIGAVLISVFIGGFFNISSMRSVGTFFVGVILTSLWILCLLQLPMLLVPKLVRAHRFGFGGESILDNWLNDIRVDKVPSNHSVETRTVSLSGETSNQSLKHSFFYNDKALLVEFSQWIQKISFVSRVAHIRR